MLEAARPSLFIARIAQYPRTLYSEGSLALDIADTAYAASGDCGADPVCKNKSWESWTHSRDIDTLSMDLPSADNPRTATLYRNGSANVC